MGGLAAVPNLLYVAMFVPIKEAQALQNDLKPVRSAHLKR